jgi:hypothetical protein
MDVNIWNEIVGIMDWQDGDNVVVVHLKSSTGNARENRLMLEGLSLTNCICAFAFDKYLAGMSSLHALHRRRSHSTSSHTPKARRTPDVSWRAATKRAHAQHSFGPGLDLSSPQKWDVDVWRRGKRARRDLSVSLSLLLPSWNWLRLPKI